MTGDRLDSVGNGQAENGSFISTSGRSSEDDNQSNRQRFFHCCFCHRLSELIHLQWIVLFVSCFLSFGMAYTMDFPGSLGCGSEYSIEAHFRSAGMNYNQRMNQSLYSVYSWPNTILAIFGGILIDRYIGLRRALIVFTLFVFLGAFIFSYGVQELSYPMMILGRIVYGLGGESLGVAQSTFISRWFTKGSGMSFAFGICLCFSRVCASFNFLLSPLIATKFGVVATVYAGSGLCGASVVAAIVLYVLDKYAVRTGVIEGERGDLELLQEDVDLQIEAAPSPAFKLSDIRRFSLSFWYLCGICLFSYNAIAPFVGFAKNFFQVKYGYDGTRASQYISACQITSAIFSPIVGYFVDRIGRNTYILIFVSAVFASAHALFIYTSIPAVFLMIVIGFFFTCLTAALWPAVPFVVPPKAVASSFGVMTSLQNVGLAIFPMIVGAILDTHTERGGEDNGSSPLNATSDGTLRVVAHRISMSILREGSGEEDNVAVFPSLKGFQLALMLLIIASLTSLLLSFALLFRDLHYGNSMLSISGAARRANLDLLFGLDDEGEDTENEESQQDSFSGSDANAVTNDNSIGKGK